MGRSNARRGPCSQICFKYSRPSGVLQSYVYRNGTRSFITVRRFYGQTQFVVVSLVQCSASFRGQVSSGCRAPTCEAGTPGFLLRVGCCTCVGLIGLPVVTAVPVDVAGIRVAALPGEAAETVVIVVVVKTCRTLIPNTNFQ